MSWIGLGGGGVGWLGGVGCGELGWVGWGWSGLGGVVKTGRVANVAL